ncbi:MAG: hypothetical protein HQ503_02450 [Rhodospirillales bacterium]|nr:hypothetical protein [Rhodospirillales bacterium]
MSNQPRRLNIRQVEYTPTKDDVIASYASAGDALDAGDYYAALERSRREGAVELEGVALLMCGWIEKGLKILEGISTPSSATRLHQAFGYWCLERDQEALAILEESSALRSLVESKSQRLLLIAGAHTQRAVPTIFPSDLDIRAFVWGPGESAPPISDILEDDWQPDLIIVFDVYGNRIPDGLYDLDAPVIFWTYDFDFHLTRQYDDLARADIISCAFSGEHYLLNNIYAGRVVTFPTHDVYTPRMRDSECSGERDLDIVHTGVSFSSLMRGKAQFLFSLAALDDPELNISIRNGFLEVGEYHALLARAKYVVSFDRLSGGIQTRAMDGLSAGSAVLGPAGRPANSILDGSGAKFCELNLETMSLSAGELFEAPDLHVPDNSSKIKNTVTAIEQIFPASPEREVRFIKRCLFQSILLGSKVKFSETSAPEPSSIIGPHSTDENAGHSRICIQTLRALELFAANPLDADARAKVDAIMTHAGDEYPASIPLNFNIGRYLWAADRKDDAAEMFKRLYSHIDDGLFDPKHDDIRIHFLPLNAEMTPFEEYYNALSKDLSTGDWAASSARAVVAATAQCYIGLYHLQLEDNARGIEALQKSMELWPAHFPAARLLAKAMYADGQSEAETLDALLYAAELFAPYLTELLPMITQLMGKLGDDEGAKMTVKSWCNFITRTRWARPSDHPIPEETWDTVALYLDDFPDQFAQNVNSLRREIS